MKITITKDSRLLDSNYKDHAFGEIISDHMFVADYENGEWKNMEIKPYSPISIMPSLSALHYGQSIFEGMKAFVDSQDSIMLFRANKHLERFNNSAERLGMPTIPDSIFIEGIKKLISIDKKWIPTEDQHSLYIRPFMFATDTSLGVKISKSYKFIILTSPVAAYFSKPLHVKIETHYSRSCSGGVGFAKAAGNYAGAMYPTKKAQEEGFDQVIWTDAATHTSIEESGVMNVMFIIDGKLTTPLTKDSVLKGITRDSILHLAKHNKIPIEERNVTVPEIIEAHKKGLLQEAFGVGTAATITDIYKITYDTKVIDLPNVGNISNRLKNLLLDIKTGKAQDINNWISKID